MCDSDNRRLTNDNVSTRTGEEFGCGKGTVKVVTSVTVRVLPAVARKGDRNECGNRESGCSNGLAWPAHAHRKCVV